MSSDQIVIEEVIPSATWNALSTDKDSMLVDVRTLAEWTFVGVPDLSSISKSSELISWSLFPEMEQNPEFAEKLANIIIGRTVTSIYFICRSGGRSLAAAAHVATDNRFQNIKLINVSEGFEGDLNEISHRSVKSGWKASGLPWTQS